MHTIVACQIFYVYGNFPEELFYQNPRLKENFVTCRYEFIPIFYLVCDVQNFSFVVGSMMVHLTHSRHLWTWQQYTHLADFAFILQQRSEKKKRRLPSFRIAPANVLAVEELYITCMSEKEVDLRWSPSFSGMVLLFIFPFRK